MNKLSFLDSYIRRLRGRFNVLLEAILPRRPFEEAYWSGPATLTIVCDDGPKEDIEKVAPILDKLGIPGVFAIITSRVGQPGYMDVDDLKQLKLAGHEIASHMNYHKPLYMIPASFMAQVLARSRKELEALLGGLTVRSLVFPYGYNSRGIRREVHTEYLCGVSAWQGLNYDRFNRYAIRRVPFGSYTKKGQNTLAWYQQVLDRAIEQGAWMVLMLHSAKKEHDGDQSDCLRIILEQARDRGVKFATLEEAMLKYGLLNSPQTAEAATDRVG